MFRLPSTVKSKTGGSREVHEKAYDCRYRKPQSGGGKMLLHLVGPEELRRQVTPHEAAYRQSEERHHEAGEKGDTIGIAPIRTKVTRRKDPPGSGKAFLYVLAGEILRCQINQQAT